MTAVRPVEDSPVEPSEAVCGDDQLVPGDPLASDGDG
jgi:hypothetical protein